jgi:uncharacterized repeat protein (TIGR01451 family)
VKLVAGHVLLIGSNTAGRKVAPRNPRRGNMGIPLYGRRALWLAWLTSAAVAMAQNAPISSEMQVSQVETIDGRTVLRPVQSSKPGEVLEYRVTYRNHSDAPVSGLTASLPIPAGTTLLDRSQLPPDALASSDGVRFAPLPLMRRVRQADGSERSEPVPLEDYRALRWNLGTLQPGSSEQVSARVRVNSSTPAVAASSSTSTG